MRRLTFRLPRAFARLALVLLVAATAFVPAGVHAQAEARRSYEIPAGTLEDSLNRFARQSGITLSFDPAQVAGRSAAALSGEYNVQEGLNTLLAPHQLQAVKAGDGSFALRPAPASAPKPAPAAAAAAAVAAEAQMPEVTVDADAERERAAVTEGTGSYTTRSMSTATGLGMTIRETPQSVSVITRQRMDDQGIVELTDAVKQTTGLTLRQDGNLGSDSSEIYSRGFAVENYQIDGIGHLHSNYSMIFQTNDMVLYDRMEVVRGATGLMNGIGTPSATINLVRKRPTAEFQGYARLDAGSWDYYRAEADVSSAVNEAGTVRARLVAAYQDNASYIDRLKEQKTIVYGVLEADLTPSTLATIGLTLQSHDYQAHARSGLPLFNSDDTRTNFSRSDSAAASWAYSKRENDALFASLEHRLDNEWVLKATYSYDRTSFDEVLGYAAGGSLDKTTGAGLNLWAGRWAGPPEQNSIDVRASGPFELFGRRHEAIAGVSAAQTKQDTESYNLWWWSTWDSSIANIYTWDGTVPGAPDNPPTGKFIYTEKSQSAYGTVRFKPFDPLAVIVGARTTTWKDETYNLDYATQVSTDTKRTYSGEVTPYAGIVYDIDRRWSVYASYTNIFQPQSAMDPNGNFLDPLIGNAYEAGIKAALFDGALNLSAAAYRIVQDNFGVEIPGVLAPDGSQAYESTDGATTRGFELEVSGALSGNWQASAGFARNLVQDREGQWLNTDIPSNTFKLFTTYRIPTVAAGLTLGGGYRWQSSTWTVYDWLATSPRATQDSYGLLDLMANLSINRKLSVSANIYNVADKSYLTSTGSSYYGEPRSAKVGLTYKF